MEADKRAMTYRQKERHTECEELMDTAISPTAGDTREMRMPRTTHDDKGTTSMDTVHTKVEARVESGVDRRRVLRVVRVDGVAMLRRTAPIGRGPLELCCDVKSMSAQCCEPS